MRSGGGKHRLHVINAGDSRTLLGKRDGSIVDGGGTDKGGSELCDSVKSLWVRNVCLGLCQD